MSSQSTPTQTTDPSLTQRQLSAIKVIKYLFISSLLLLIIGSVVLFCIAIDSIVNTSETINTIEQFGVTELAIKRSEQLKQQRFSSIISLIIHLLIVILSSFGIIAIIKDNFLLIILFGIFNTLVLIISLWSTSSKAAIILLQIAVTLFAFSYTLSIYHKMRAELKKKQKLKNKKEVKNNIKNNHIESNHKSDQFFEEQLIDNQNNNPEFNEIKDLKELNGIIV